MEELLSKYPISLDVKQSAEILNVSDKSILKLIASKQLAAVKVGRIYRIPRDKLVDFMNGKGGE